MGKAENGETKKVTALRSQLLAWYAAKARDLPWRRTSDPYAILVSEVMLQQTRVETAGGYYGPFLERFPNVDALAAAPMDQVLKAWEGLGYYRRAHALHAAAIRIVACHGGQIPSTAADLRKLPGVGPYTAAAVASIAFGHDEPILDGNAIRVIARLFAVSGRIDRAATRRQLRSTAANLVPPGQAGDFNQAVMDLGSQVCTPAKPDCGSCPVSDLCAAHATGYETDYPVRAARKAIPHRDIVAAIIWDGMPYAPKAQILISKRQTSDMLGGLWEFPGGHVERSETMEEAVIRELREELAIEVSDVSPFMTVKHAYTHFRMTLHVFHCVHTAGDPQALASSEWTWTAIERLERFAFPTADRKIIQRLIAESTQAGR